MIVFGGRRVGGQVFCNARCLLNGRAQLQLTDPARTENLGETIRELRDAMLILAEEVEMQRVSLNETSERLDFAERTLTQLRHSSPAPPSPQG